MTDLPAALAAWQQLLGPEHVISATAALAAAQTATFATHQRIPALIRPASRAELQACVRIAARYQVPLCPISQGKNWGYGSRVPATDGCVLAELGRMNRILDYDEKLAYVTLEPGVTFQQLYDFLARAGSNLMINATGSAPDTSVIGNTLERGVGAGPYADRAQYVCNLEVVLPGGELIHTGYGRFDTPLAPLHAAGVGPQLAGMFTQSSYGIVTRMTVWLAPRPAYFHTLYFRLGQAARLPALIDALQQLKLAGPPQAQYSLWNDYKLLATVQQYPWQAAGGRTPLPDELRAGLCAQLDVAAWNGFGGLYSCSRWHGRAERDLVARALKGKADNLTFVSDTRAQLARVLSRPLRWLSDYNIVKATRSHDRSASPWFGVPSGNLSSAYWRKATPVPATPDPDADGCGVIWCSPCVPFDGRQVAEACAISERVLLAHQFEPNIALIGVTPRVVYAIVSLIYDRAVPGEDQRARACHDTLLRELVGRGYLPYRLGLQSIGGLPPAHDDDVQLHGRLRAALDPHGILAPGRYDA